MTMASEQPGPGRVLRAQPTVDPSSLADWRDKGKGRLLAVKGWQGKCCNLRSDDSRALLEASMCFDLGIVLLGVRRNALRCRSPKRPAC